MPHQVAAEKYADIMDDFINKYGRSIQTPIDHVIRYINMKAPDIPKGRDPSERSQRLHEVVDAYVKTFIDTRKGLQDHVLFAKDYGECVTCGRDELHDFEIYFGSNVDTRSKGLEAHLFLMPIGINFPIDVTFGEYLTAVKMGFVKSSRKYTAHLHHQSGGIVIPHL